MEKENPTGFLDREGKTRKRFQLHRGTKNTLKPAHLPIPSRFVGTKSRSNYHTQFAKVIFVEILDLTAEAGLGVIPAVRSRIHAT